MPRNSIPQSQIDTATQIARRAFDADSGDPVKATLRIERERSLDRQIGGVWLDQAWAHVNKCFDEWAKPKRFFEDDES